MSTQAQSYSDVLSHVLRAGARPVPVNAPDSANTEALLISRLRAGDERAFNELVDTYHGTLIRMAMRHVADHGVAEEVVQEAWIAVIDGIPHFAGHLPLGTWLFSILMRKAKTRGARERKPLSFTALKPADEDCSEAAVDATRFLAAGEPANRRAAGRCRRSRGTNTPPNGCSPANRPPRPCAGRSTHCRAGCARYWCSGM